MKKQINTIIFDLGGVLLDWNPEYVYRDVFDHDQKKIDWFLNDICNMEWNVQQDAGRTLQQGTDQLVLQHPEYEDWIRMFYDNWNVMLDDAIHETVDLLKHFKKENNYRLYSLTNWSHETFPIAWKRFEFLQLFEGILVSGIEKTRKPLPEIYELLLKRYQIDPKRSVFIDDNLENIEAAEKFGIHGIHYKSTQQLKVELLKLGVEL